MKFTLIWIILDFSFPIPLPFKPYLQYYVDTFDEVLDIKSKLILLKEIYDESSLKKQDLKSLIYSVKDEMWNPKKKIN